MENHYKSESTSKDTAKIEDIELSISTTTRRIIRPIIVNNPNDHTESVKIDILHQRKKPTADFEDITPERLSSYKAKDIGKLSLTCEETKKLHEHLKNLYAVYNEVGISIGESDIVVGRDEEIIKTDRKRAHIIRKIIESGHSAEVWQQLSDEAPDLAIQFGLAQLQKSRITALNEFSSMLLKPEITEPDWQNFFEKNTWIFGYGLNYQILRIVNTQPNYGNQSVEGKGGNRGDFLQSTQGKIKFTVLVEIKKPTTLLLDQKPYRNDVFLPSNDLIGGASQVRMNNRTWETQGSDLPKNRDLHESFSIYTIKPKSILVIGNTSQLTNRPLRENFELFRRGQADIEIITFDELHERAKFIVEHDDTTPE